MHRAINIYIFKQTVIIKFINTKDPGPQAPKPSRKLIVKQSDVQSLPSFSDGRVLRELNPAVPTASPQHHRGL